MDSSRRSEEPSNPLDIRPPFRHDRDRILYCGYFARLAEITQVVSPGRGYVFHNRLTHSLKVGQVARTIAERFSVEYSDECAELGGIDPDAAEAAGLAHDLGHPPFGHIAEEEINKLVKAEGVEDGFEGNAQTFRLVCSLAISGSWNLTADGSFADPIYGLNLTRSTLAGLVKYPWPAANGKKKWGFYKEEAEFFSWAFEGNQGRRTLIAELMDWADDVTYAIHDLLDFYRAGMIPLELMREEDTKNSEREKFLDCMFNRREEWRKDREYYVAALDSTLDLFPFQLSHRYSGEVLEDKSLDVFKNDLLSRYIRSIRPVTTGNGSVVEIDKDARFEVDVLKQFIWHYVILRSETEAIQMGQRRAIRAVFRDALKSAIGGNSHFFPGIFRERLLACSGRADHVRLAADYVAAMTEREIAQLNQRLRMPSFES